MNVTTIFEQFFYFVLICGSHINRAEQWINDKDKIFRAPKWKFIRALEESDKKLLSGFCQTLQTTRSTLLLLLLSFWEAVGHCLRLWHCYEQNKDIAWNKSSITFWISVNILLEFLPQIICREGKLSQIFVLVFLIDVLSVLSCVNFSANL